jgi:hypothetical protein
MVLSIEQAPGGAMVLSVMVREIFCGPEVENFTFGFSEEGEVAALNCVPAGNAQKNVLPEQEIVCPAAL